MAVSDSETLQSLQDGLGRVNSLAIFLVVLCLFSILFHSFTTVVLKYIVQEVRTLRSSTASSAAIESQKQPDGGRQITLLEKIVKKWSGQNQTNLDPFQQGDAKTLEDVSAAAVGPKIKDSAQYDVDHSAEAYTMAGQTPMAVDAVVADARVPVGSYMTAGVTGVSAAPVNNVKYQQQQVQASAMVPQSYPNPQPTFVEMNRPVYNPIQTEFSFQQHENDSYVHVESESISSRITGSYFAPVLDQQPTPNQIVLQSQTQNELVSPRPRAFSAGPSPTNRKSSRPVSAILPPTYDRNASKVNTDRRSSAYHSAKYNSAGAYGRSDEPTMVLQPTNGRSEDATMVLQQTNNGRSDEPTMILKPDSTTSADPTEVMSHSERSPIPQQNSARGYASVRRPSVQGNHPSRPKESSAPSNNIDATVILQS